ncbi:MAG: 5-oxoprolinase subunit PxpB, partial [Bacillales bacterium]|nr:5-oxoprolinase subunit PxpB [Bacillales bacterium]
DIEEVASTNGLSVEKVIEIHSSASYHVYFLGFAPGFPFLGGMDPSIATPRKQSPRLKVPAGSVGIAGNQTGIYPIETPGGWQIIGRTPISLFQPDQNPPTFLLPGDKVRFVPITKDVYENWEDQTWEFTSQKEDY